MRKIDEAFSKLSDQRRARDLSTAYGWVLDTLSGAAHFLRRIGRGDEATALVQAAERLDEEFASIMRGQEKPLPKARI